MGGKKKPTISQLVKREEKEKEQKESGKRRGKVTAEETTKKTPVATVPIELYEQIAKEIKNMDYVTTYVVSSRYSLKMGAASRVLNDLAKKGELILVSKSHRTSIYVPVERAKKLGLA